MGLSVKRPRRARPRRRKVEARQSRFDWLRRAVDIISAIVLLIVLAPLLVAAILGVAFSGRPIFFDQDRLGRGGKPFRFRKLRTMWPNAEDVLRQDAKLRTIYVRNGFKIPGSLDPRITRIGRLLRCTYLDELPQLFNLLGGSMSLIGPRPMTEEEIRKHYGNRSDELLQVKPGLLGEWTSRGRRRPVYPERARLELDYVRRRSLGRDLLILLRSIPAIITGQNF